MFMGEGMWPCDLDVGTRVMPFSFRPDLEGALPSVSCYSDNNNGILKLLLHFQSYGSAHNSGGQHTGM